MRLETPTPRHASLDAIDWTVSRRVVPYLDAVAAMEARVAAIRAGDARELLWLLEHPALYTAGTSAQRSDLVDPARFPVFQSGRGGQYTYHGPGQRVVYVMLDVKSRFGGDVRGFVKFLEAVVIETLAAFGIPGELRDGRVGVWVRRAIEPKSLAGTACEGEAKIAALGIRLRRGVSYHGLAINVAPDLSHFSGIVPCGISGHGVTSLRDLGVTASLDDLDAVLRGVFSDRLGPLMDGVLEAL